MRYPIHEEFAEPDTLAATLSTGERADADRARKARERWERLSEAERASIRAQLSSAARAHAA